MDLSVSTLNWNLRKKTTSKAVGLDQIIKQFFKNI